VERHWFIRVAAGDAQIRCSFERLRTRILRFTVQLEIFHGEDWFPVVRCDNPHDFCQLYSRFPLRFIRHPAWKNQAPPVFPVKSQFSTSPNALG
jgi:hypothetical protein